MNRKTGKYELVSIFWSFIFSTAHATANCFRAFATLAAGLIQAVCKKQLIRTWLCG